MAKLDQMVEVAGSVPAAEVMAYRLIREQGPEYLLDLQLLLSIQGKFEMAKWVNEQALDYDPSDLRAQFNMGWMQLRDGDFSGGILNMNAGRLTDIWGNGFIDTDKPIWQGEDLTGKRLLFNCEAGFGDEIIFIRFVEDLHKLGAEVTVACSESLMSIFNRLPFVSCVIKKELASAASFDYWLPSMAAPIPLKTEYEDLSGEPYLTTEQSIVDKYAEIMDSDKLKVGIRWRGLPQFERDQFRKFPEKLMFDAVNQPGVQAYSLQRDLDYRPPEHVVDLEENMTSWDETAAIIANLDLVVTSCTAVAHLAAALGVKTWVLIPILHYFVWALPGPTSPWYDSVELYRQTEFGSWVEPFNKIAKRLDM